MKNKTRSLVYIIFAVMLTINACGINTEKLEERNNEDMEEKKEAVMAQMEIRLKHKYHEEFDVYDLKKGSTAAWFMYGDYPATAICLSDEEPFEFKVEIETDSKRYGSCKDNYYGYLYGDKVKKSLENLVSAYPLTDIDIAYATTEDIPREESDLRKNLRIYGEYHITSPEDLDTVCELIDELNGLGYLHRIAIYDDTNNETRAMVEYVNSSKEIRKFFKA